jgi:hypothetical protein
MNTKKLLTVALLSAAITAAFAQKKYEKIAYGETSADGDGITVSAKNVVSMEDLTKFSLRITNKTNDILLYKAAESKLKAGGKEYAPSEKPMVVAPNDDDSKVIDIKGKDFMIPDYSFVVDGIYKISTENNPVEAPNFLLPASQNEFKAGNFTCTMLDLNKETDKTTVKFECRYNGNKIGVINPSRASVKLPDGTEIANEKSKAKPILVMNGESEKFTLRWNRMEGGRATDMQKIQMTILWHKTFIESEMQKIAPVTLNFKIDEGKSK